MSKYDLLIPSTVDHSSSYWATVTQASPLRIKLDGESTALPFTPDTLVAGLAVNDRVRVEFATNNDPVFRGRRAIVVGRSGGFSLLQGDPSITTEDSATFSNETQVQTVTLPVVAGHVYKVVWNPRWRAAGQLTVRSRIREDSVSGDVLTEALAFTGPGAGSGGYGVTLLAQFVADSTGSKTFSLTGQRETGSDVIRLAAGSLAFVELWRA